MRLYIDPGTGSMLFTILIGVLGAAFYSLRMLFIKLRYALGGGKSNAQHDRIGIAVFSDNKRYWKIFEPVFRELDKRGKDVLYLTMSEDDPAFSCELEHVKAEYLGKDNKAFTRLNFLKADILFSTTPGLDVYQWKRSKDVKYYVHIPHAASEITLYRMFGIDYYDAILLSGDYQATDIRNLETLRGLPEKELVKVGIPYMDEMAARFEREGDAPAHERTVLLAPTWGNSGILSVYGKRILDVLLNTGYRIIVRPHPQSFDSEKELLTELMNAYPDSDQLEWNRDIDNFEVLRRSDILISDFSGVIFDFSLIYDKPVIYTNPHFDVSMYDAWWLDTPLWTLSALPRLGKELNEDTMEHLKELIEECISDPGYTDGRREVKEETWAHFGESAARTADYLINKHKELTAEKEGE